MIIYTNKNGKICWKPVLLKSFLGLMLIVSLFGLLSFQPSRKPRDNHQVERTKLIKEIQSTIYFILLNSLRLFNYFQ